MHVKKVTTASYASTLPFDATRNPVIRIHIVSSSSYLYQLLQYSLAAFLISSMF